MSADAKAGVVVESINKKNLARRQLIQFLAASPLLAGIGPGRLLADTLLNSVSSPEDALDVFDFQRVAEQVLPPAHYGYVATQAGKQFKGGIMLYSGTSCLPVEGKNCFAVPMDRLWCG